LPKNRGGLSQADVGKDAFVNFFGATPGRTHGILLTRVDANGLLGEEEIRPSVTVRSHNYRFEIGAASGLRYPSDGEGRPIATFVRLGTRTFRYHLSMPGDVGYEGALGYLLRHAPSAPRGIRRYQTTARQLIAEWPACPLFR
jgi:hypothetical protein